LKQKVVKQTLKNLNQVTEPKLYLPSFEKISELNSFEKYLYFSKQDSKPSLLI